MATERPACPSCGAAVLATDTTCMSCGATLRLATNPQAHPQPPPTASAGRGAPGPPPVPPAAPSREVIERPWAHRVVERFGRFWDLYPWLFLATGTLGVLGIPFHLPAFAQLGWGLTMLFFFATYLVWLVLDVVTNELDWWWILIGGLVCFPIGFFIYLVKGR